jgi:hypothetical protein
MGANRPHRRDGNSHAPTGGGGSQRVALTPESSAADVRARIERWEQVDRLLDLVEQLPLGHPDRVRLLGDAEQILDPKE